MPLPEVSLILLSSLLVKLTAKEADLLVRNGTTDDPGPGGLSRILAHDWSFDPRKPDFNLLLRRYHEQDQVLYEAFKNPREHAVLPASYHGSIWCHLCAAHQLSPPIFVATHFHGYDTPMCCACAAALGFDLSPQARAACALIPKPPARYRGRLERLLLAFRSSLQCVLR